MARINSTNSTNNEWPKAFYDDGGGSYGFVPTTKLQSGVVTANLQLGNGGPLINGSTGQIIIGSGSTQYIFGPSGITVGGQPFGAIILQDTIPWPDAGGVDSEEILGPFTLQIPHGLEFAPVLQCFTDLSNLSTGNFLASNGLNGVGPDIGHTDVAMDGRSWNNLYPTYDSGGDGSFLAVPSQYATDVATDNRTVVVGSMPAHLVDVPIVYYFEAGADDEFLNFSLTILGENTRWGGSTRGTPAINTSFVCLAAATSA